MSPKDRLIGRSLNRVHLGSVILFVLVLFTARGNWRLMAALVALQLGHGLLEKFVHPWWYRHPRGNADTVLGAAHAALCLAQAHLVGWNLPAWGLAVFPVFASASHQDRECRGTVGFLLGACATLAALDGVAPLTIASYSLLSLVLYAVWEVRARLLREALAALGAERAKLGEAERRLLEQEKMSSLGMLAAGVAHEINNPMSYVTSNIRQLHEDLRRLSSEPGLVEEYLNDVVPATLDGAERVNAIVADLRRFARGEVDHMVEFDLNAEVQAALRMSQSKLRSNCTVDLSLGDLPPILGRPQEITRVVLNLLVNAAQAMKESGTVRVTTRREGDGAVLAVTDSGCGMSPATLSRIFQPFFTTKPLGEGMGLGLAVAHGIVTAHGGRIDVQSEEGKGSTFTVWLPAAPPQRAVAEKATTRRRAMSATLATA